MKWWCIVGFMKTRVLWCLFIVFVAGGISAARRSVIGICIFFFFFLLSAKSISHKAHGYLRLLPSSVSLNVSVFLQSHIFIGLQTTNRCSWNVLDCDPELELFVIEHAWPDQSRTARSCRVLEGRRHGYRSGWHARELERPLGSCFSRYWGAD